MDSNPAFAKFFEMAAMPFPCNGHLSVVFSLTYSFLNILQKKCASCLVLGINLLSFCSNIDSKSLNNSYLNIIEILFLLLFYICMKLAKIAF